MAIRRNFLQSLAAMPTALMAAGGTLPTVTMPEQQAKLTREPFGDLRIYFEGPTAQIKSMTAGSLRLKAGMSPHPPHTHPEEEFMVVTEGNGEIVIEGKTSQVGPGAMMYCAANKSHGIRNTGPSPLHFFFYKWKA
ncbi:MAG TPA: cupin domain-containing protein [Bryobacteraceae bacterium]|nr:cupin domain-containing protein [Bryobacteraceae bacterium]